MLAHDLIVWTQALLLDGELAKAEPKRLRYRLLHVAGRLAFPGRRAGLHLQRHLALGPAARRRVRQAQSAPSRRRLTRSRPQPPQPPAPRSRTSLREDEPEQPRRFRGTAPNATTTTTNTTITTTDHRAEAPEYLSHPY